MNLKQAWNMKVRQDVEKQGNRETWPGLCVGAKKQAENRNMEIVFRDWIYKQKC